LYGDQGKSSVNWNGAKAMGRQAHPLLETLLFAAFLEYSSFPGENAHERRTNVSQAYQVRNDRAFEFLFESVTGFSSADFADGSILI
jgi:hypothetical protein